MSDHQPNDISLWDLMKNGAAWTIILTALFFVFGADVLNGFVDLMHALGAK